jgi:hypothetical protein
MDFITSGAFLGIVAIIVAIFLITLMRRVSIFFLLVATVGTVILAGLVIITILAISGADRFALDHSNPLI